MQYVFVFLVTLFFTACGGESPDVNDVQESVDCAAIAFDCGQKIAAAMAAENAPQALAIAVECSQDLELKGCDALIKNELEALKSEVDGEAEP